MVRLPFIESRRRIRRRPFQCGREHRVAFAMRHDDRALLVAHHDIPGLDAHATADHRYVKSAENIFVPGLGTTALANTGTAR